MVYIGTAYLYLAISSAGASIAGPCPVSTPRSSNPAGGFPTLGSRTKPCLRPRKPGRARSKASPPMVLPQGPVRESARISKAHVFPASHLVLRTQPLAQPPGRVPIHCGIGRAHLAQEKVAHPAMSRLSLPPPPGAAVISVTRWSSVTSQIPYFKGQSRQSTGSKNRAHVPEKTELYISGMDLPLIPQKRFYPFSQMIRILGFAFPYH